MKIKSCEREGKRERLKTMNIFLYKSGETECEIRIKIYSLADLSQFRMRQVANNKCDNLKLNF